MKVETPQMTEIPESGGKTRWRLHAQNQNWKCQPVESDHSQRAIIVVEGSRDLWWSHHCDQSFHWQNVRSDQE